MNTPEPPPGKRKVTTQRTRLIHKNVTHSVSEHPQLWEFAKERAKELDYHGGVSGYIGGLILFDMIARRKHWLTAPFLNDPEQLEAALRELPTMSPEAWASWIECRVRDAMKKDKSIAGDSTSAPRPE